MKRRNWLKLMGAGLPFVGAAGAAEAPVVKMTGLEVFRVHVNRRGNWVLFRIQTSEGLTGIGDASHGGRDDQKVAGLGQRFFEAMKDHSIFDIERLREITHPEVAKTGRPAAVALGGLEQCLWDLQGKVLGVPTYQLFGGMLRRRIRNYANINRSTDDRTPAGFARNAASAVEAGFDAVKLAPFDDMARQDAPAAEFERDTQLGIDCIAAVREVMGPDRDVLVDAHSHFDTERGVRLAQRLEPYNLFWLEEVSRPFENLAVINREAPMPTAGGESLFGVKTYHEYIAAGAADIMMPDIKYCGGLMELKKIAAMAEGAGLPVSPHGPASPVGNMAAAHVCATLPNFQILEFSHGEVDWRAELVEPAEELESGYLTVPDRPGIGYALNEATIRKHAPKD
jgi:galactonate dehydratase